MEDTVIENEEVAQDVEVAALPEEEILPAGLREAFSLLNVAQSAVDFAPNVNPTRNPQVQAGVVAEYRKRTARLKRIKAHVLKLQQGLPVIVIGANDVALIRTARANQQSTREGRLNELAARNSVVADML